MHKVAGLKSDWTMAAFRGEAIAADPAPGRRRARALRPVGRRRFSAVAAVLIHEAIGERLTCVFVDHGLLRQGEAEEVVRLFRDHYNIPLHHVEASDLFLGALEGVDDPEVKRKTIGRLFIEMFEAEAKKIAQDGRGAPQFLAQGTLYPDVIESVSFTGGPSVTIKSHHNVGGLPERMNMKLVEPLRELFKDEVRALGPRTRPAGSLRRAPSVSRAGPRDPLPRRHHAREARRSCARPTPSISTRSARPGLYDEIWQAFAVLLPVRTRRRDGRRPHLRLRRARCAP